MKATQKSQAKPDAIEWAAIGLAGLTGLIGGIRALFSGSIKDGIDDTTLKYFAVAGVLLLLRKIKSLSFGDYKAEFQELQERTEEAVELAKTAENMARVMPATPSRHLAVANVAKTIKPGVHEDDPWKGQFGGQSKANGRRMSADVKPLRDDEDWFLIRLLLESMDPRRPLQGLVQFFIHDSFPNDRPTVEVVGGVAELRLTSYGAFTVGALADNGQTKLELDLAEDPSFPDRFRDC